MKNIKEKEINKEISKYLSEKKSVLNKLSVSKIKETKRKIKTKKREIISDLIDVCSYRQIMEDRIEFLYNEINQVKKRVKVKPNYGLFTLNDVFQLMIRFLEKDLPYMLSEKYFIEKKKYRIYKKRIDENILNQNIDEIIKMRKEIIDQYFIFILSFYRKIPDILKDLNKNMKEI